MKSFNRILFGLLTFVFVSLTSCSTEDFAEVENQTEVESQEETSNEEESTSSNQVETIYDPIGTDLTSVTSDGIPQALSAQVKIFDAIAERF